MINLIFNIKSDNPLGNLFKWVDIAKNPWSSILFELKNFN